MCSDNQLNVVYAKNSATKSKCVKKKNGDVHIAQSTMIKVSIAQVKQQSASTATLNTLASIEDVQLIRNSRNVMVKARTPKRHSRESLTDLVNRLKTLLQPLKIFCIVKWSNQMTFLKNWIN